MKESDMVKVKTITVLAIILVTVSTMILIYQDYFKVMAFPPAYDLRNYTFGVISSIQNDEGGKPTWIVAGHWKTNLLSNTSSDNAERNENMTKTLANGSSFDIQVEMVKLDGTAGHTHTITNFVLANVSQPDNMTKVLNGTTTASMIEGPVTDIPTTIKIMGDKVISIQLDPSKIDEHYGNTPIYGLVMDDHKFRPPIPPKVGIITMGSNG